MDSMSSGDAFTKPIAESRHGFNLLHYRKWLARAIFGKSIASIEEYLNADAAWPPGTYRVLEKSDSLPPGVTNRLWRFMMKAPDASVVSMAERAPFP